MSPALIYDKKLDVPDLAKVPKLEIRSAFDIPIPES
jgi:hypothetical protein